MPPGVTRRACLVGPSTTCRRSPSVPPTRGTHEPVHVRSPLHRNPGRARLRRPRRGPRRRPGRRRRRTSGYAPADTARIHPGTMMYTDGAQCTANFVYTDASANTYVGYAAHCAGLGAATDTDGCQAASLPLGTKVSFVEGGSLVDEGTQVGTGTLAYSSWLTEKKLGTTDAEHLRLQRPRAGQGLRRGRRARSTRRSRSGAARPASTPTAPPRATTSTPTATPACAPASRRSRRTAA